MSRLHDVVSAVNQYEKLEKKFGDFAETMKNIPPENEFKVSIDAVETTKFTINCCRRKIKVEFSSFGQMGSKFLGKISFKLPITEETDEELFSIYFDEHGNNYNDPEKSANSWTLTDPKCLEFTLVNVIEGLLKKMAC
jgi:hypothetical protein